MATFELTWSCRARVQPLRIVTLKAKDQFVRGQDYEMGLRQTLTTAHTNCGLFSPTEEVYTLNTMPG